MSRSFVFLGFVVLTLLNTVAHIAFKLTATAASPVAFQLDWVVRVLSEKWLYVAVLCYLGTFATWMTMLSRVPLGPAFAASHLELLGVLAASALLFGDRISIMQWLGVTLILGGVICISLGQQRAEPPTHGA